MLQERHKIVKNVVEIPSNYTKPAIAYLSSVGDRASSYPGAAPRQSFFSGTPYMRLKDRGASLTPERSTLDVELAVHFHELIGASVAPRPTSDHQT